jgi:hypothetical protein
MNANGNSGYYIMKYTLLLMDVWEEGVQENILIQEIRSNRSMEQTV